MATGRRDARASPSAKKPADRSSSSTRTRQPRVRARGQGQRRRPDPGQTMTSVTPASTSASTISRRARTSVTARRPARRVIVLGASRRCLAAGASPPSASDIVRSLSRDSSHSRAGSESATMPQPANSVACEACDEAAAKRDHQLAVPIRPEPADRPGVPAAIERLVLGDERQGDVARRAAHGRRRVQPAGQREQPGLVARGAGDRRHEVLEVAQRQDRPACRRRAASRRSARGSPGACRRRRRAPRGPSRSRAAPSRAWRPRLASPPRGADPAMATVSNDRPPVRTSRSGVAPRNVVPFAGEGERRALRRRPRQVAQRRDDVEIGRSRSSDDAAGQHDLVDPTATDRAGEQARPSAPSPARSGRSSVVRSTPAALTAPSRALLEADEPSDRPSAARATACHAASTSPGSGSSGRSAASATVSVADGPLRGHGERRQDERRGPERRPRIVWLRVASPLNPSPPSSTGPTDPSPSSVRRPGERHRPGPPARHAAASAKRSGPAGLDRPRPPDADDRAAGRRLEPQRRLEVERAGGREQRRSDRSGRSASVGQCQDGADRPARRLPAAASHGGLDGGVGRRAPRRSATVTASMARAGRRSAPRRRRRSGAGARAASGRPIRAARGRRPAASGRRPR